MSRAQVLTPAKRACTKHLRCYNIDCCHTVSEINAKRFAKGNSIKLSLSENSDKMLHRACCKML